MDTLVDDVIKAGSAYDQKQLGTHKIIDLELADQFRELLRAGINDVAGEKVLRNLLRGFETVRVTQEREIRRYEQAMAYCRARQRAALENANLIVAILATTVQELKDEKARRDKEDAVKAADSAPVPATPTPGVLTEEEFRQTHCACACQDDVDARGCACLCHTDKPCKSPTCLVCPAWRKDNVRPKTIVCLPSKLTSKTAPTAAKKARSKP